MGWPGPLAVALFAAWHLSHRLAWRREWLLVLLICVFGFCLDTFWIQVQILNYSASGPMPEVAPGWIVALWANFALTINHSMLYMRERLVLAALLGAIGGPVSYLIAAKAWDAATFGVDDVTFALTLGVAWAIATPVLFRLAKVLTAPPTAEPQTT
jgi:drug/metabolite transporter (DMT)-like permease